MIPNVSPFQPGDKVVAYCRYSEGDDQGLKNTSVDEQEQAIREFCKVNSIQLVQVFADPFASGRSVAKRDKYLEMLSYLLHGNKKKKKDDIQGVILWDYERYGRNYDRAQYDAAQLRMKGYKLFSMQQPITDNSPFAHVLESMYFASAQNQSDMISADVKRALQSNFNKWHVIPKSNIPDGWLPRQIKIGYYTDGRVRYGHQVVPDPEYKDKIKDAVQACLDGVSWAQLRQILGKKFSTTAKVEALLRKPLLYGSMTYGGTTIDDFCEPLIDKETYDKLQVLLDAQPKRRRSAGAGVYSLHRAMLSGLLVCGVCHGHMHLDSRKAKGHLYETYYCNDYHVGIRREIIENLVLSKAFEWLSGDVWEDFISEALGGLHEDFLASMDKSSTEKKIREIDRNLKRLYEVLLTTDAPPQMIVEKMNDLETERKKLMEQLSLSDGNIIEKARDIAEKTRSRILSVLQSKYATADDKRNALALMISEIIIDRVDRHRLQVTFVHGVPGFLEVADDFGSNLLRPSSTSSYTCNLVTEVVIVDCRYYSAFGSGSGSGGSGVWKKHLCSISKPS